MPVNRCRSFLGETPESLGFGHRQLARPLARLVDRQLLVARQLPQRLPGHTFEPGHGRIALGQRYNDINPQGLHAPLCLVALSLSVRLR